MRGVIALNGEDADARTFLPFDLLRVFFWDARFHKASFRKQC
jgi:hypothetical protein